MPLLVGEVDHWRCLASSAYRTLQRDVFMSATLARFERTDIEMSESLPLKFGFQVQGKRALATGLDFAFRISPPFAVAGEDCC